MEFGSFGFLRRWEIRSTRKKNLGAMDTTNKSSEYYGHLFTFAVRVHLLEGSFSVECATLTNRELKQDVFEQRTSTGSEDFSLDAM